MARAKRELQFSRGKASILGSLEGNSVTRYGLEKRGIYKERPIEGKDKRSKGEKRNEREGEGGKEGKVGEEDSGRKNRG